MLPAMDILSLRQRLAALHRIATPAALSSAPLARAPLGGALDAVLDGGLARAALHEIHTPTASDSATGLGFAAILALRAASGRPILWVRQDALESRGGRLHPPGLAALGLDPSGLLLVRARDAQGVLRAGGEAARCPGLGAVLIEPMEGTRLLDLTATRRLSLAAQASGVTILLLRGTAPPRPSAATTRWLVRARPSRVLAAQAPGQPSFAVTLLRQRGGVAGQDWRLDWNPQQGRFHDASSSPTTPPFPRPVVPLPADRSAAPERSLRRAG